MKLRKFPKIEQEQFVVVFADINSGTLLNLNLQWSINPAEQVYMIFNNLIEAENYCKKVISETKNIEYHIYDYMENYVKGS
jgi:hypothetical protein